MKLYLLSESNLYAKTLLPEFIRTKKMIFLSIRHPKIRKEVV
ncbi:hypothetical protein NEISICOT_03582 [Neisseria sicca ATCC 29256]|uniref:Uncharacterized protein n=1 Tax=Neisseria sicca ATCC 29256 TaxID=547045 RepID=C6MAK0_NEISI|nr:hypothetical protein NEISICOT_03582 [Neisseria sicca ATCC 29256]